MGWLVLTLISAVTGALTKILQKVLLTDAKSDPFAFVFQLIVAGMFLLFTLVTHTFETPTLSGLLLNFIVMTVFCSLGNVALVKAFHTAKVSEVTIIFLRAR